jgi:hypothetical protein
VGNIDNLAVDTIVVWKEHALDFLVSTVLRLPLRAENVLNRSTIHGQKQAMNKRLASAALCDPEEHN